MIKPVSTIGRGSADLDDILYALEIISKQINELILKQPLYSVQSPPYCYTIQPNCECHLKGKTAADHICPIHG